MKQAQLLRPLSKTLAIVLCLSLMTPVGKATEATARSASCSEGADGTASIPKNSTADSPQMLSDEELAELSARAEEPGPEVMGGALSNLHLTYIVIALAAAVIVLIAK